MPPARSSPAGVLSRPACAESWERRRVIFDTHLRCIEVKKSLFPISNVSLFSFNLSQLVFAVLCFISFLVVPFFIHFATFSVPISSSPPPSLPTPLAPSFTPHPLFHQQPPPHTHSFPLHSQSLSPLPPPPSGSFPPIFLFLTQTVGLPAPAPVSAPVLSLSQTVSHTVPCTSGPGVHSRTFALQRLHLHLFNQQ